MRLPSCRRGGLGLGVVAGLLCAGCTITFHSPVRFRTGPEPGAPAVPGGPGPVVPAAPLPAPPPPIPPLPPNEHVSLLMQKLMGTEDDRKVLAAKLQQVETQLREKDQAVVQASYEIQESTKQIKKTRDEMVRWRQEMDDVRAKIRAVERENRTTLESVLKTLEQYMEREKEAARPAP